MELIGIPDTSILVAIDFILAIALVYGAWYATQKFKIRMWRTAWYFMGAAGALLAVKDLLELFAHGSMGGNYEFVNFLLLTIHHLFLIIGIFKLAMTADTLWGKKVR